MLSLYSQSTKPVLTSLALALSGLTSGFCHGESTGNDRLFPLSKVGDQSVQERPSLDRQLVLKSTQATKDQIDPLRKSASINFSADVVTIRQATKTILKSAGYELLESGANTSELLTELLDSPLPDNLRSFYHLHIYEMLRAIAGVGFVPVFDHLHRKVTFDPKPLYVGLGSAPEKDIQDGAKSLVPAIPDDTLSDLSTGQATNGQAASDGGGRVDSGNIQTKDTPDNIEERGQDISVETMPHSDAELALKGEKVPQTAVPIVSALPEKTGPDSSAESLINDQSVHVDVQTSPKRNSPEDAKPLVPVLPDNSSSDLSTELPLHDGAPESYAEAHRGEMVPQSTKPLTATYSDETLLDATTGLPAQDGQWQVVGANNVEDNPGEVCATPRGSSSDPTRC